MQIGVAQLPTHQVHTSAKLCWYEGQLIPAAPYVWAFADDRQLLVVDDDGHYFGVPFSELATVEMSSEARHHYLTLARPLPSLSTITEMTQRALIATSPEERFEAQRLGSDRQLVLEGPADRLGKIASLASEFIATFGGASVEAPPESVPRVRARCPKCRLVVGGAAGSVVACDCGTSLRMPAN